MTDLSTLVHLLSELPNLRELSLSGSQITDVSPLSELPNLDWLDLSGNQIIDVSPLSALTNLRVLGLRSNQITDVSPLSELPNLHFLGLSENQITDLSALSGLRFDSTRLPATVNLELNPLNCLAYCSIIPAIEENNPGIRIDRDPKPGECECLPDFLRGDCDGDGDACSGVNDALTILGWAFLGGTPPPCVAACDANGTGEVDLTDAVYGLNFCFQGTAPPVSPYPQCGVGLLPGDELLGCVGPPANCP